MCGDRRPAVVEPLVLCHCVTTTATTKLWAHRSVSEASRSPSPVKLCSSYSCMNRTVSFFFGVVGTCIAGDFTRERLIGEYVCEVLGLVPQWFIFMHCFAAMVGPQPTSTSVFALSQRDARLAAKAWLSAFSKRRLFQSQRLRHTFCTPLVTHPLQSEEDNHIRSRDIPR
jgi:hypothetical protein